MKRGLRRGWVLQAGATAAKVENALGRLAASSHEPDPDGNQGEEWQEAEQQAPDAARIRLDRGRDVVAFQRRVEGRVGQADVVGEGRHELGVRDPVVGERLLQVALRALALDRDVGNFAAVDLRDQLRVGQVDPGGPAQAGEDGRQQDDDVEAETGQEGKPKPGTRLPWGFRGLRGWGLVGPKRHIRLVYAQALRMKQENSLGPAFLSNSNSERSRTERIIRAGR